MAGLSKASSTFALYFPLDDNPTTPQSKHWLYVANLIELDHVIYVASDVFKTIFGKS
jgi:hypothetical protein